MNKKRLHRGRQGQILVLAAVILVVLILIAALVVDVGYAFVMRAQLQNAADAASLAAVQELIAQRYQGESEEEARSAATAEAQVFVDTNCAGSGFEVAFGTIDEGGELVEQGSDVTATAACVVASRNDSAPAGSLSLFFAPFMGMNSLSVSASATCEAASNIMSIDGGLSPFAVYEGDVPAVGETMIFFDNQEPVPGCFGLLSLDGGSCATSELLEWIVEGYDGGITIDPELGYVMVGGDPGFRAALASALQQRVGDLLIVCVYDQVTGQGSNAQFRIVSFLSIELIGFRLTGTNKYIEARVTAIRSIHDAQSGGVGNSSNFCKVQLVR